MQNNSTDQTRNALGQILKTQEALRAWRDLKLKPSELPNKEQFERGRSIANQNTLMRLMYSAVSENLLPEGTEVTLRYAQTDRRPEKSVYVSGAASILRELYTRDVEQPLQFDITINGTSYSVDSPTEFWQSILVPNVVEQGLATQEHCDQALYELVNSVNNEMLSMASMLKTRENLKSVAGGSHNMWEWLVRHADQEMSRQNTGVNNPAQLLSTQQYIERLGSFKGHPTHPMAKMKGRRSSATDESFTPLSVEEVVKYSPEFGNEVSLLLVSVDADHLNAVGEDGGVSAEEYLEFFAREYPIAYKTWEEDAPQAKASGKLPVPIHPLQIEEIKRQMPELLESGIVAMPSYEEQIRARPTISMRTLMTPNGHQVKTTVGMQMTTVVRTNAPSRVHNGPLTSGLVKKVVNSDERFADSLALVDEPMGIYLKHDGIDNDSYKRAYHLNALFKNNPTAREGEIMMPVATLYANSPFTGRAVIADMLAASGRDNPDAALAYFTDYARMVVHNDVGMFARYGISLEGHQQNTLVAFDKSGTPSRSIYRDFSGGVEVYEPILASQKSFDDAKLDMRPHLHEVTSVLDDSMEAPLNQVVHTTIRLHLLPMVDIFEKEFGMDRDAAMETLRNTVKAEITAARNEHTPKIKEEKRDDYEAFLDHVEQEICETPFSQKSMLLARLQGTQSVKFGAPVDNPLSR